MKLILLIFTCYPIFCQNGWFNFNTSNSGLPYNDVKSIEFGSSLNSYGEIFVGTSYGLGVLQIDNENLPDNSCLSLYSQDDPNAGLLSNEIVNISKGPENKLWICTTEGISILEYEYSFNQLNYQNWSFLNTSNSDISNNLIRTILFDDSIVWMGSSSGLDVKEGLTWQNYSFENEGVFSNNIKKIIKNPITENIYIGTLNGGFQIFDGNNFEVYNNTNSGLLDNTINDFTFDSNNNLIITSPFGGLEILTYLDNWVIFNSVTKPDLPFYINSLNNVIVDNDNNLWISTLENGLIKYMNNEWFFYNEENSELPDDKINCLKYDSLHNILWIGTETEGLVMLDLNFFSNTQNQLNLPKFKPYFSKNNLILNNSEIGICRIYNRTGKLIHIEKIYKKNKTIRLQNLYSEFYIIQLETKDEIFTERLIRIS